MAERVGFSRDEGRVAYHQKSEDGWPAIVDVKAGWVVPTTVDPDELPEADRALLAQSAKRIPGLALITERVGGGDRDGEREDLIALINDEGIASLLIEVLTAFGNRDLWKALVATVPEEWTR